MEVTKNRFYLRFIGFERNPNEISKMLNINPTEYGIKGQSYFIGPAKNQIEKKWDTNYWEYRVVNNSSQFINEIFNDFLNSVILPIKNEIKIISNEGLCMILIVQEFENEPNPGFYFDRKQMEILNEINAELDIDIYCL